MMSGKNYVGLKSENAKEVEYLVKDKIKFTDAVPCKYKILGYVTAVTIVAITVVLVIVPTVFIMEEHSNRDNASAAVVPGLLTDNCRVSIAESIPDNLTYDSGKPSFQSTFLAWSELIDNATQTIDIASFYWTLRGRDVIQDPSDWQGETIFKKLKSAVVDRKVKLRIVMNKPSPTSPDNDTVELAQAGAEVRSIDFYKLLGSGILHTKLWIVDKTRFYVGSANMDWRALTQVKELGVLLSSCPSLVEDASKLFEVYWYLGKPGTPLPPKWPDNLTTKFNKETPMKLQLNGTASSVYLSSSPLPFCPKGRTNDIDAILDVIGKAQKFIHIAVMDYIPMIVFGKRSYWPVIDDALRKAAVERKIEVRLLASIWNHTTTDMIKCMKSLQDINGVNGANIETRLFCVPAFTEAQKKIPYSRVNHNKYMVTDNAAYIGTSNLQGDYFTSTTGVGLIIYQTIPVATNNITVLQQMVSIFDRDWTSKYATPVGSATHGCNQTGLN